MTTALVTPLTALTDDLDAAVRGTAPGLARVGAVGHALAPHLGDPRLLRPDQCVGDPERYTQHVLHVAPDGAFSLVALVWLPGQTTPIHDHLSWCVVGVYAGEEHETRYRRDVGGHGLLVDGTDVAGPGNVAGLLPPGDIHRVTNGGTVTAISLLVDGTDVAGPGNVAGLLPPGDIHRVTNGGTVTAISLHVYGLDVSRRGSSIRRRYDLPVVG